jgi:hypothetical protein
MLSEIDVDSGDGFPNRRQAEQFSHLKSLSDKPRTKDERRTPTLGAREKQQRVQLAFLLRYKSANHAL